LLGPSEKLPSLSTDAFGMAVPDAIDPQKVTLLSGERKSQVIESKTDAYPGN